MATGNLAPCLAITLPHEGGYVDHPKDPGGATNMGITFATLAAYRGRKVTKADVRALTVAEAREIYRVNYWNPVKGDLLPAGVDVSTFDYGVNSGPSRSIKELQRVAGVPADGRIGGVTLTKVRAMDAKTVVQKHCARRLSFVRGLTTFKTFGKGWSRRIADIEARGVAMAVKASILAAPPSPVRVEHAVSGVLEAEAAKADKTASAQSKGATATTAGGATVGGGDALASGEPNWLLIVAAVAIVVVVAGVLIVKSRQNKDRAEAYKNVAAEG